VDAVRFPIQEYGMNFESQPLQRHEITSMTKEPLIIERIITSYRMMLDFYGMRLISAKSGLIDRVLPPRDFIRRYSNLVRKYFSIRELCRFGSNNCPAQVRPTTIFGFLVF